MVGTSDVILTDQEAELLWLWEAMDLAGRAELLANARSIACQRR
jgi:hypothetical protein